MRYTNKHGLPESFLLALEKIRGEHVSSGADIGVTALIGSPRIKILSEKYSDMIEEDVSENILPLLGQAVHHILEKAYDDTDQDVMVEGVFYGAVCSPQKRLEVIDSTLIAGIIDLIKFVDNENPENKTVDIYDYKTISTTAYSFSKDGKPEWTKQLDVYAWLLNMNGYTVRNAYIVALMRDWMRQKTKVRDYPDLPIKLIPVKLSSVAERKKYVQSRVEVHEAARIATSQASLPNCTSEEMWERKTTFAVKKKKLKRAVRVFDTMTEANDYAKSNGEYWVEERPGARTRCEGWCPVSEYCEQYKEYINGRG